MERFVELLLLGNALLFLLPAEESYVDFMSINQKVCWGSRFVVLILTRLATWRLCAKRARYSLTKQPKSSFTAKWPLRNERRNSLLMTRHYPDLWFAEANFPRGTTNQKHCPDLSSDASSVWNICASVITRRNQWWSREMLRLACEQDLLFGPVKRVSRERASERRSREVPLARAFSRGSLRLPI